MADFLLEHGADINTNWSSHEPASILHELVFHANYDAMRFLIDRGIDMTIEDYRWNSTARGWALYAARDENMARWLEDAQQQREQRALSPSRSVPGPAGARNTWPGRDTSTQTHASDRVRR